MTGVSVEHSRRRAVIIGVNLTESPAELAHLKYAEADARAMHAALVDENTGTFNEPDVDLLVGPSATAIAIKETLRDRALRTEKGDQLLVYYAGHAYRPKASASSVVYLATRDMSVDEIERVPDLGLRMSSLRSDVFAEVRGTSVFILDSCLADTYIDPRQFNVSSSNQDPTSHAALLACADSAITRERTELKHGEFTHAVLEGLRGEALGISEFVTLESLYTWLERSGQRPLIDARNWQAHVPLTRPTMSRRRPATPDHENDSPPFAVQLIDHPLQDSVAGLRKVIDQLSDWPGSQPTDLPAIIQKYELDSLRTALNAETAGIAEVSRDSVRLEQWLERATLERYQSQIQQLGSAAIQGRRQALAHIGSTAGQNHIYSIPLNYIGNDRVRVAIVVNPRADAPIQTDPLAILVRQFLNPAPNLRFQNSESVRLGLLTALRQHTGRLPLELYDQAFNLYRREIDRLVIVLEPVIRLAENIGNGGTQSYEALARRHLDDRSAPGDLLGLAKIWGDKFFIERDLLLAGTAIRFYSDLHRKDGGGRTALPIAINVAPQSLMSAPYSTFLKDEIRRAQLQGLVTLEISEQDPIVVPEGIDPLPTPMEAFKRHLLFLLENGLEVNFAIDDFGVGHSSLHRLASLSLAQIKIDRSILEHPLVIKELELVIDIAKWTLQRGGTGARPVILEGVDEQILAATDQRPALTLSQLWDAGIRFIQGHLGGPPRTIDLRAMEPEAEEKMRKAWNGSEG